EGLRTGPGALGSFGGWKLATFASPCNCETPVRGLQLPRSGSGGMLSPMASLERLRPAMSELVLAFLGLLIGVATILVLGGLGVVPTGDAARWFGFVG